MRPPCELVVRIILPYIRARIAKQLIEEYGYTPTQVSRILKISKTSVLKYRKILKESPIREIELMNRIADEAVKRIIEGEAKNNLIELICRACMLERMGGVVCSLHRRTYSFLKECNACRNIMLGLEEAAVERAKILGNLMEAYNILSSIDGFNEIIPEVRTNIVMCVRNADKIEDVAGFPGRITVVKGRASIISPPEFGASKHLATVLLEARRINPEINSCTCIKYSRGIEVCLRKLGYRLLYMNRQLFKNISDYIKSLKSIDVNSAIIDLGGSGIEPVTYIFASSAVEVAKKVKQIAYNMRRSSQNYSRILSKFYP
ncbi:MAG: hypothetical protein DRJ32_05430 [Thermoprotei archaeon]|nr:MAG: hypothetical protein DRJ32_05430 [Thermoprotei archaeon]